MKKTNNMFVALALGILGAIGLVAALGAFSIAVCLAGRLAIYGLVAFQNAVGTQLFSWIVIGGLLGICAATVAVVRSSTN